MRKQPTREGVAARGGDVDTVWVNGYGFPDVQGGPTFMANRIGLRLIVDRLGTTRQFGTTGSGTLRASPC